MSKQNKKQPKRGNGQPDPAAEAKKKRLKSILGNVLFVLLILGIVWGTKYYKKHRAAEPSPAEPANAAITSTVPKSAQSPSSGTNSVTNANIPSIGPATNHASMEVNHAVMVTVELDFGPNIPSIAEALQFIERRFQPDDGKGRTFAILDAYGEPTADKKKLHLSMHVSTEKPGGASLIFSKTGEVLWKTTIVASTNTNAFSGKDLTIYLGSGIKDQAWLLDGSMGPPTILDAKVRDLNKAVREVWLDGEEREMTFVYSACGCPVKVMAKRTGDRTIRTKELPVIFPDDPAAVGVITKLMGW